jgi:hypothetical protein
MLRTVVALGGVLVALAVATPALAHHGAHWTSQQAAKRLVNGDIVWSNGTSQDILRAICVGFGHNFIGVNGQRVFWKFRCNAFFKGDGWGLVEYWAGKGNRGKVFFLHWL